MTERQTVPLRISLLFSITQGLKSIRESKGRFIELYLLNNGDFSSTEDSKNLNESLQHDLKYLYPVTRTLFYKGPKPLIPKPTKKRAKG